MDPEGCRVTSDDILEARIRRLQEDEITITDPPLPSDFVDVVSP